MKNLIFIFTIILGITIVIANIIIRADNDILESKVYSLEKEITVLENKYEKEYLEVILIDTVKTDTTIMLKNPIIRRYRFVPKGRGKRELTYEFGYDSTGQAINKGIIYY